MTGPPRGGPRISPASADRHAGLRVTSFLVTLAERQAGTAAPPACHGSASRPRDRPLRRTATPGGGRRLRAVGLPSSPRDLHGRRPGPPEQARHDLTQHRLRVRLHPCARARVCPSTSTRPRYTCPIDHLSARRPGAADPQATGRLPPLQAVHAGDGRRKREHGFLGGRPDRACARPSERFRRIDPGRLHIPPTVRTLAGHRCPQRRSHLRTIGTSRGRRLRAARSPYYDGLRFTIERIATDGSVFPIADGGLRPSRPAGRQPPPDVRGEWTGHPVGDLSFRR